MELGPPLTAVPVQALPGQPPARRDAVEGGGGVGGVAGAGSAGDLLAHLLRVSGEVTNSPACTVGASPGRVTAPILVQRVPSAES